MNATKTFYLLLLLPVLAGSQAVVQLRVMSNDESAGRLALLRKVDFESRTDPQENRRNFRVGGIIFTNVDAIRPCRGCDPSAPSAAPVILVLNERGTMTFLSLPRFVVIDTLNEGEPGEGPFEFRVTDGANQQYRVSGQGVASGHGYFGLEATYGIREMELVSFEDGNRGPGSLGIDAVYASKVATPTRLVAKPVWSTQVNLTWKHTGRNETGFLIERSSPDRSNFVQVATVEPNVKSFHDVVGPTNRYFYRVRANHPDGESAYSNIASARTRGRESRLRVTSIAAEDGYVCEELAMMNQGTVAFPGVTGGVALITGDQAGNQQCKAIISFDTSALPDTPEIVSAVLTLRRGIHSGNPFGSLSPLVVDINSGDGFGGSPTLNVGDFEAMADAARVAILRPAPGNRAADIGRINSSGFRHISTTGRTQFRIYFAQPDDGDFLGDFVGWYSGEGGRNAPVLDIVYTGGAETESE